MSYALSFSATDPAELWAEAGDAAAALVAGERDGIANMANVAALIWQAIPDLNWAGFYRFDGSELVLGPFQGKAACIRIALDKGVCGAAARLRATQRVDDVLAFPGHIACDADSRSELVVPVIADDRLVVCGISFGYEDAAHPANSFRTRRAPLSEAVAWLDQ